jgi:hypothetical protein
MTILKISTLLILLLLLSCSKNPSEPDDNNPDPVERSWQLLGLEGETIKSIEIDPEDESIIYAGSGINYNSNHFGGFFKSTNSGVSWDTLIGGISVTDVDINPVDPQTIYVSAGVIFKTEDGGENWTTIYDSLNLFLEEALYTITIDPVSPETIYTGAGGPHGGGLRRSRDGGITWNTIDSNQLLWSGILTIIVKPDDNNTIYVGTADIGAILRTIDGGDSWDRLDIREGGMINHLSFNSGDYENIYACIWRHGFYKSTDSGDIWQQDNTGLPDSTYKYVLDIEYHNNEIFIATFSDSAGVYKSACDSISWERVGGVAFDNRVNTLAITDNGTIFVGSDGIYGYLEVED